LADKVHYTYMHVFRTGRKLALSLLRVLAFCKHTDYKED